MQITVRPLELADVPRLVHMEREIFTLPWSEQNFKDLIGREYCLYLVAVEEEQIVGCSGMTILGEEGDIDKVMVCAEGRRRGIASCLLGQLLAEGRKRGIKEFTLEVRVRNTGAIRLYEKFGFTAEGVRPGFYEKPSEDALIMWLRQ